MKRPKSTEPPALLDRLPQARIWIEAGISLACAGKLVRAGYASLEDLDGASREDLLAVGGIGAGTLEKLEQLLGHPLPSPSSVWLEKGLPPRVATALGKAGIDSLEALGKLSREELLALGVRRPGLERCEALLGRPIHSKARPRPVQARPAVKKRRPARLPEIREELESLHHHLLEMLVPLQNRKAVRTGSRTEDDRLRLALWNAARELDPLLSEAPAGLDLRRNDPAVGEALYAFAVRRYFSLRLLADPGYIYIPKHSPEECQLRVFHEYGRWWLTWLKLEGDMNRPEAMTRELLLIETADDGRFHVTAV
jgi:hypothetical protein